MVEHDQTDNYKCRTTTMVEHDQTDIITNVGLLTMVEHDLTDIITNVGLLTMVEHDLTDNYKCRTTHHGGT